MPRQDLADMISNIVIPIEPYADKLAWQSNKAGNLLTKHAYQLLFHYQVTFPWTLLFGMGFTSLKLFHSMGGGTWKASYL